MLAHLFVGASLLLAIVTATAMQAQRAKPNVMTAWAQAFNNRDAAAIAGLYTEDATLFPADEAAVKGRGAIERWYQKLFATSASGLTMESERSVLEGPIAFETGEYAVAMATCNGNKARARTQRYMWSLRRAGSDSAWRIDSHMFNADRPSTPCK